jgi:hypothetical protein
MIITDNYHYDGTNNADDDDDDDDDVRNVIPSMSYHQHRTESKI